MAANPKPRRLSDPAAEQTARANAARGGNAQVQVVRGNPDNPEEGAMWVDAETNRLKVRIGGTTRSVQLT